MRRRSVQTLDVRVQSMRLLLSQVPVALVVNVANAWLLALVLAMTGVAEQAAWWWFAAMVAVSAWIFHWRREARRLPPSRERLPLWERRAIGGALLSGSLWGAGVLLLFPHEAFYQVFVAFVIGGMAAGAGAGLSYLLPVYFGFVLPSVLPLVVRFLVEPSVGHLAMGAMVLIFVVALTMFARNQHAVLTRALALQLEKGALARDLATLLENLELRVEERTQELRVANEQLQGEVEERLRAEAAEREARAAADQANAAKSVFLAAASHDLRQPIHALRLYLDVLGQERPPAQKARTLRRMSDSLDAVRDLLDTLMDLSALESGRVTPALQAVSINRTLAPIAGEARLWAERRGLRLLVHRCPRPTMVSTDPVLLGRMVRNLVVNAIRHTPEGAVLLACRPRRDHVLVQVWDTGSGIPAEKRDEIFREFYQAHDPHHPLGRGLGLGLWIVARTAQILQHEVEVSSRAGKGSVFSIRLARPRPR